MYMRFTMFINYKVTLRVGFIPENNMIGKSTPTKKSTDNFSRNIKDDETDINQIHKNYTKKIQ